MTHFTNQAELAFLSDTELRLELREIFNLLVWAEKNSPEYNQASATLEEVKLALRRRHQKPQP